MVPHWGRGDYREVKIQGDYRLSSIQQGDYAHATLIVGLFIATNSTKSSYTGTYLLAHIGSVIVVIVFSRL